MTDAAMLAGISPEAAVQWVRRGTELPRPSEDEAARDARALSVSRGRAAVEAATATLAEFVSSRERDLSFRVDEDSGRTVITVSDAREGTVIRQIPGEEVLAVAARIAASGRDAGIFLRESV